MPVKRRTPKGRAADVSDVEWALLTDGDLPPQTPENGWDFFGCSGPTRWSGTLAVPSLEDHWRDHGEGIVEDWVAAHPGTRPSCWWQFDAPRFDGRPRVPTPRLQVGGSGAVRDPATIPRDEHWDPFPMGMPASWRGCAGWDGYPDPADPPLFEAQAAYLERHGLLLPNEREAVPADGWAPEPFAPLPGDRR